MLGVDRVFDNEDNNCKLGKSLSAELIEVIMHGELTEDFVRSSIMWIIGSGNGRRYRLRNDISEGGPNRLMKYVCAEFSSGLIQVHLVAGQLSVVGCHSHKHVCFMSNKGSFANKCGAL